MTYLMNGTNAVGQMNGTNAVGLNGTNSVALNGTGDVGGNYSELTLNGCPCSQLQPDEISIYGLNGTQEEMDAFKLGVLYGDQAAVAASRRSRRAERFASRQSRLASGGGFFQNLGEGIKSIAPGLAAKLAGETEDELLDMGVYPDETTLLTRSAQQAGAGVRSSDTGGGWCASQPTATKAAIIGGGVLVAFLAAKQFGLIGGKKGKSRK